MWTTGVPGNSQCIYAKKASKWTRPPIRRHSTSQQNAPRLTLKSDANSCLKLLNSPRVSGRGISLTVTLHRCFHRKPIAANWIVCQSNLQQSLTIHVSPVRPLPEEQSYKKGVKFSLKQCPKNSGSLTPPKNSLNCLILTTQHTTHKPN